MDFHHLKQIDFVLFYLLLAMPRGFSAVKLSLCINPECPLTPFLYYILLVTRTITFLVNHLCKFTTISLGKSMTTHTYALAPVFAFTYVFDECT